MKKLIKENIPCWYELSWDFRTPAIILKIHKDFIEHKGNISRNAPIILGFKEDFKSFGDFRNDFQGDIGFDGVFRHCGEDGEFIKFVVDIPIIESKGDKCEDCDGSGINEDFNDECLHCNGLGKQSKYDWNLSYSISANFTILFTFLYIQEFETKCEIPQLLEVNTITRKDIHGGSLCGQFSIPLVNWLKTITSEQLLEIKEATKRAYNHMFYSRTSLLDDFDFKVNLLDENGKIAIDCPGDACGIHPSDFYSYYDEVCGYEFSCHNVDGPAQQLTLLAGLAALHDKARKEIKVY